MMSFSSYVIMSCHRVSFSSIITLSFLSTISIFEIICSEFIYRFSLLLIIIGRMILAQGPVIVVLNKLNGTSNHRCLFSKGKKHDNKKSFKKYLDVRLEVQCLWKLKAEMIPAVIRSLGNVISELEGCMNTMKTFDFTESC